MRLAVLLFTVILTTVPGSAAQEAPGPAAPPQPSSPAPAGSSSAQDAAQPNLPVSLDRIRKALAQKPAQPLLELRERPTFRIDIQERNRLQDLIETLDFRGGPTPAGGLYAAEMQRVMFPSVSNPLRQPFAAFNQPELLTILIQTVAGTYLAGRAIDAITSAGHKAAEAAAREELRRTIVLYCDAQPNGGAGIEICMKPKE